MNFLVMPLFFLSGALFPLDGLPPVLLGVVKFDPLSYGIDSFRILLTGTGSFGIGMDLIVLAAVAAVFLGLSSYSFSKIQI
jgi:ABC-2 type transport system permease protein